MSQCSASLLYSSLGDDPDMGELVEMFVADVPGRIDELQQAIQSRDLEIVQRLSHQLKGAVGGYGFDQLTPIATAAEQAASNSEPEDSVLRLANELTDALSRVRAGSPQ